MSQFVLRALRQEILNGGFQAGEWIRQEIVARQHGTSRIPVREALRQLEAEGLVTLVPHSGAYVARLDFEEYTEIYKIREALEPLAIAESTMQLTLEQLDRVEQLADEIEMAEEFRQWLDLDRRFHLLTYQGAAMPRLLKMIDGFWNSTQHYRRAFYSTLEAQRPSEFSASTPASHLEHRLLVDALKRRDSDDASSILRSHIRRTRTTLAQHQELFDHFPLLGSGEEEISG
jgi:DNA-binding GntR family transcriptional regulator